MSTSGKHEPCVISTHVLQSAFLQEERENQLDEAWCRRELPHRAKSILGRLAREDVPHPVLRDHRECSSLRKNAVSVETQRLIDYTHRQRHCFCTGITASVALIVMSVFTSLCLVLRDSTSFLYLVMPIISMFAINLIPLCVIVLSITLYNGTLRMRTGRYFPIAVIIGIILFLWIVISTIFSLPILMFHL